MYISTRGNYDPVSASKAINLGMVPAGGLFVPEEIPLLSEEEILSMKGLSYQEVAQKIISLYLDDFQEKEIKECVTKAYNSANFYHPLIAPVVKLKENTYILELWHGPTAAFKDMALQILPFFLVKSIRKIGSNKETVILVATSGDTGKAALEGFKNVEGIKIIVFYPYQGVSKIQELQMSTTDGNNTYVVAVKGNFDDCQGAVKEIFGNREFNQLLAEKGYDLSSANSINWGRLLPQIVYYFTAYLNLLQQGEISAGEKINYVVPTGNFGNILAAWYAYKMGLPVNKLICASNENKVLTDFFHTGIYNKNREFKQTNSPSMDILVSSNLERFLFEITGHNSTRIKEWMEKLNKTGEFQIDNLTKTEIDKIIYADFASEKETLTTIKKVFSDFGYALDPHTAVAVKVYENYKASQGDNTKTIIDATASPFKFNTTVLEAIQGSESITNQDEFLLLEKLSRIIDKPIHPALKDLDKKPVLHKTVCSKTEIKTEIEKILGL
jgi:threonine synthase